MRLLSVVFVMLVVGCIDHPTETPSPACIGDDTDEDGILSSCDNCPDTENVDQIDSDHDGVGNACDTDKDNDGLLNADDLCPEIHDTLNQDFDEDGIGDVCDRCPDGDADSDDDGIKDCLDTCPTQNDPTNADQDGDGIGDVCDVCPTIIDAHQNTTDGKGDACHDHPFTIQELTIDNLHDALSSGDETCESVIENFVAHIGAQDLSVRTGPPRNAFVSFNEDVRAQARKLDDIPAKDFGPLHCVPFVIKTNFEAPEIETTGGTFALAGTKSPTNSPSVQRLRDAGAILIGSTTMDEFARGVQGIGSRSGKTGNAYDPNLHSGGSSAGTGVAVGANFAMFGLGTDNCASLLMPANLNGLTSIRSTHHLIELDGMLPSGLTDGVAGPMARSVGDMARVMDYLVATERPDTVTRSNWTRPDSYFDLLKESQLDGKRIGILRGLSEDTPTRYRRPYETPDPKNTLAWHRLFDALEKQGAVLVENVRLEQFDPKRSGGGSVSEYDKWFKRVNSPVTNYEGMCDSENYSSWIWADSEECRANLLKNRIETGYQNVADTRQRYYRNAAYVESVMDELELDVLLYPTTSYGAARSSNGRVNCILGSTTGLPNLTVITSIDPDSGLPFGVTVTGRNFDESELFQVAHAIEKLSSARPKPTFDAVEINSDVDLSDENDTRFDIGAMASQFFQIESKSNLNASTMEQLVTEILEARDRSELLP